MRDSSMYIFAAYMLGFSCLSMAIIYLFQARKKLKASMIALEVKDFDIEK